MNRTIIVSGLEVVYRHGEVVRILYRKKKWPSFVHAVNEGYLPQRWPAVRQAFEWLADSNDPQCHFGWCVGTNRSRLLTSKIARRGLSFLANVESVSNRSVKRRTAIRQSASQMTDDKWRIAKRLNPEAGRFKNYLSFRLSLYGDLSIHWLWTTANGGTAQSYRADQCLAARASARAGHRRFRVASRSWSAGLAHRASRTGKTFVEVRRGHRTARRNSDASFTCSRWEIRACRVGACRTSGGSGTSVVVRLPIISWAFTRVHVASLRHDRGRSECGVILRHWWHIRRAIE